MLGLECQGRAWRLTPCKALKGIMPRCPLRPLVLSGWKQTLPLKDMLPAESLPAA